MELRHFAAAPRLLQMFVLLLSVKALTIGALAQMPAEKSAEIAPKGAASSPKASDFTLADLQGLTIHTTNSFVGHIRNMKGEFPGGWTSRMEIKIGPNGEFQWNHTRLAWVDAPKGRKNAQMHRSGKGKMGSAFDVKDGSGQYLWLLEGDTLTSLRVFETGGMIRKIKFDKSAAGLKCTASATLAREVGAGPTKDRAAVGGKVQVLNARPTSSSCRIVK
jgi:hypothetical protein